MTTAAIPAAPSRRAPGGPLLSGGGWGAAGAPGNGWEGRGGGEGGHC